jgi:hypothetical protein
MIFEKSYQHRLLGDFGPILLHYYFRCSRFLFASTSFAAIEPASCDPFDLPCCFLSAVATPFLGGLVVCVVFVSGEVFAGDGSSELGEGTDGAGEGADRREALSLRVKGVAIQRYVAAINSRLARRRAAMSMGRSRAANINSQKVIGVDTQAAVSGCVNALAGSC